ncbi:hypothetical protein JMJ35_008930 [Cladonia borealis]|uniref:Protein HGH1 homolog n=1 Tax=Cladonia borealis TaxID=184061 RepID=A0AA39QVF6_9LECA|nr:hypothetical protein JMJ35_008930 [Cladonia borealis]
MPTELEELVGFLHHGNTQIRQIAAENLVPYSKAQPNIFKTEEYTPVKDLKLLVRDYSPIANSALTILINISVDHDFLKLLAEDNAFLETLLGRVTSTKEPNGNEFSMLLANIAKSPSIERLITLKRSKVPDLSPSQLAIAQLIELFNRGANGSYNKDATYDYLAYLFADLAKFPAFVTYLTTPTPHTTLDPLTSFLPHTMHPFPIRRLGTASLLKNIALLQPDIPYLLQPAHSILPPLILPLCSPNQENISEEEMEALPEECQYLTPEHQQEKDMEILKIHLETLFLLATRGGVEGRRLVREGGTYPVVRELHLDVEEEGVRRGCERLVDVIMGDEAVGGSHEKSGAGAVERAEKQKDGPSQDVGRMVTQADVEEDDEDDEIVPIF